MAGFPFGSRATDGARPTSWAESTTWIWKPPACEMAKLGGWLAGAHAATASADPSSPAANLARPLFTVPGKAAVILATRPCPWTNALCRQALTDGVGKEAASQESVAVVIQVIASQAFRRRKSRGVGNAWLADFDSGT